MKMPDRVYYAAGFLMTGCMLFTLGAAEVSTKSSDHEPVSVKIMVDPGAVSVDGKTPVLLKEFPNGVTVNGVSLRKIDNALSIKGINRNVAVQSESVGGWQATLSAGDQLDCAVDADRLLVDWSAGVENGAAVELGFQDGAKAQMAAGATARYDLYKDESYYLAGRGRISAVDADGMKRDLSQFTPPMVGGPLRRVGTTKKDTRMQRMIPLVEVSVSGKGGEPMDIYVGNVKMVLEPAVPKVVELPNGTKISFAQNPNGFLDWEVQKGLCRVRVAGFDCWAAFGQTGQGGSQGWNVSQGAVAIVNRSPTNSWAASREVLVRIANRLSASVNPSITFQYVNIQGCTTFVGTSDGTVEMYNPDSRQVTLLNGGLKTFRRGVVAANLNLNAAAGAVQMNWEGKSELKLSGTGGDLKMASGSRKTVTADNAAQYAVEYGADGQVSFKAVSSSYSLRVAPLKDWQVQVGEGDGIRFLMDQGSGVFYGSAYSDNAAPVSFITPEGRLTSVDPGGVITVIGGQQGSLLSRAEGGVVFYEGGNNSLMNGQPGPTLSFGGYYDGAAGTGGGAASGGAAGRGAGFSSGGMNLPSGGSTPVSFGQLAIQVDPSRISQPPVSVVGGK